MRGLASISCPISRRQLLTDVLCGVAALTLPLPALAATMATTSKPRRMVSVGGALTEIVYALGAERDLVGVDTTSLYPAVAQSLPSVGYARSLSVEGLLALQPTQIVATEDAGPPAVMARLADMGIPLAVLAANHRFEGLLERVRRVGEITDKVPAAKRLSASLQQAWATANKTIAQEAIAKTTTRTNALPNPLRVMFVLSHTPGQVLVAGDKTSAHAMIEYAGARNALNGFDGYKPLTPEALIAGQPDVILLTEQGLKVSGGAAQILKLPGMAQTPAGKASVEKMPRVVALDAMFLLGFGPRLPAAVIALHRALQEVVRVEEVGRA